MTNTESTVIENLDRELDFPNAVDVSKLVSGEVKSVLKAIKNGIIKSSEKNLVYHVGLNSGISDKEFSIIESFIRFKGYNVYEEKVYSDGRPYRKLVITWV